MTKRIVILGGGTGGTLTANRLHRHFRHHHSEIVRPRQAQLHRDIEFVQDLIDHVDIHADTVYLQGGRELPYDVLVVATGAILAFDETEGLTGPGWNEKVFTFYDVAGATGLAAALDKFEGAFTKPVASAALASLLEEKGIHLVTEFNTGEVAMNDDGAGGKLIGYDGREVPFDLAVVVPMHSGAEYVGRSEGLGDDLNFVPTDKRTLQATAKSNIFSLGDATNVPASKAGSVTHFEGEVLVDNIIRFLDHEELDSAYDGHANCFIETGFGKALLIDFNYDTEPLPGHFPAAVGMPLLKESRMNHLGKLMFQWVYWHALLQGRDIPGIGADMPSRGKEQPTPPSTRTTQGASA